MNLEENRLDMFKVAFTFRKCVDSLLCVVVLRSRVTEYQILPKIYLPSLIYISVSLLCTLMSFQGQGRHYLLKP